jgi:hypothetical protein
MSRVGLAALLETGLKPTPVQKPAVDEVQWTETPKNDGPAEKRASSARETDKD